MNSKTAKLINKVAWKLAPHMRNSKGELVGVRKLRKNLKAKWTGTHRPERCKFRRLMKRFAVHGPTKTGVKP